MGAESVERLADESAAARLKIAATIDEIQDRFDPRRIMSDVVDRATDSGRQAITAASGTAREHPMAIGVALAAVGFALLARNRLSKATVNLGDGVSDYTDYDDGFAYEEQPAETGIEVSVARPIIARAAHSVDSNPIVSIIVGLAIGAALGALLPVTDAERRVMDSAGNSLGDAARRAADSLGRRS